MAARLTVTFVDEGYFQKTFRFDPKLDIKRLLDRFRAHVCPDCSSADSLEFWHDTTKLRDGQHAKMLGLEDGDIIDVYFKGTCTRGACPVPPEQTLPNMHYLVDARENRRLAFGVLTAPIEELDQQNQPPPPDRIALVFKAAGSNFEMMLRMRKNARMGPVMRAVMNQMGSHLADARFSVDGKRIVDEHTPIQLELEDMDLIEIHWRVDGGCGNAIDSYI